MKAAHTTVLVVALLLSGCAGSDEATPAAGRIAIEVAPLSLDRVTDADYTLTVTSGPSGVGETVWTRGVTSTQFGDGAGSVSYVGACDADAAGGVNTVTLTLHTLYEGNREIPAGTYQNPTPLLDEDHGAGHGDRGAAGLAGRAIEATDLWIHGAGAVDAAAAIGTAGFARAAGRADVGLEADRVVEEPAIAGLDGRARPRSSAASSPGPDPFVEVPAMSSPPFSTSRSSCCERMRRRRKLSRT